jgi:hypothetical protein
MIERKALFGNMLATSPNTQWKFREQRMKYLIIVLLFISQASFAIPVFQKQNANGEVSYSDTPIPGSKQVAGMDTTTPTGTAVTAAGVVSSKVPAEPPTNKPYTNFSIGFPTNQQTFQNQPTIPVNIMVDPPLQLGDKIQLSIDGMPFGPPVTVTHFEIGQLIRGTHQLYCELKNSSGRTLMQSQTITIFVKQAHNGTESINSGNNVPGATRTPGNPLDAPHVTPGTFTHTYP